MMKWKDPMVQIVHSITRVNDIPTKHHNSCQLRLLTCHPLFHVAFCMNPHDIRQGVEWGNKLSYGTPWYSIMLIVREFVTFSFKIREF